MTYPDVKKNMTFPTTPRTNEKFTIKSSANHNIWLTITKIIATDFMKSNSYSCSFLLSILSSHYWEAVYSQFGQAYPMN